jgi:hypothetical protein
MESPVDVSYDEAQILEVMQRFWVTRELLMMEIGLQNMYV